eukprot:TRINITY_DN2631_c0_g1_i1.p1 TRINITY_DN2631_c0_g1~~TRINITY_DN2631_c0_g1_i1.p1  ORF type:complete len:526 (+),score=138.98 TRINITY_DN2631_c0_g1_i1:41-1579(+)
MGGGRRNKRGGGGGGGQSGFRDQIQGRDSSSKQKPSSTYGGVPVGNEGRKRERERDDRDPPPLPAPATRRDAQPPRRGDSPRRDHPRDRDQRDRDRERDRERERERERDRDRDRERERERDRQREREREREREFIRDRQERQEKNDIAVLQKLRSTLCKSLVRLLAEQDLTVKAPSIITSPPTGDVPVRRVPEDDLVSAGDDASEAAWSSANYSTTNWKAEMTVGGKAVGLIEGTAEEAPPVTILTLPKSIAVDETIPAAHLDSVKQACGKTHQLVLNVDEKSMGHLNEWVFDPAEKEGEIPVSTVDGALLCFVKHEEKIHVYACSVEAYEQELKSFSGGKPLLFVTLEKALITIGNGVDGALPDCEWKSTKRGRPLQGAYAGLQATAADGFDELMSAATQHFKTIVVTSTPEAFGKTALDALGWDVEICSVADAAERAASAGIKRYAKDARSVFAGFSKHTRFAIIDNYPDTWPEDQAKHVLPTINLPECCTLLRKIATKTDPVVDLIGRS